jgi:hypothetical protein
MFWLVQRNHHQAEHQNYKQGIISYKLFVDEISTLQMLLHTHARTHTFV